MAQVGNLHGLRWAWSDSTRCPPHWSYSTQLLWKFELIHYAYIACRENKETVRRDMQCPDVAKIFHLSHGTWGVTSHTTSYSSLSFVRTSFPLLLFVRPFVWKTTPKTKWHCPTQPMLPYSTAELNVKARRLCTRTLHKNTHIYVRTFQQ